MKRWRGAERTPSGWGRSVVTIGMYDGVHRGHQYLLQAAVRRAHAAGLSSVAVTFDPHPSEVVRPGSHPPILTSVNRKAELLAGLGLDALCVIPFTAEFSRLQPDEFV
ncbi:MAG: bifunctional riboflavin kinase/FAD synthetase, partial [Actinomycetota bacterium]|nr:bifunctional riboflavin kinase/FAD synthetase [Actinomycetota bacterium]